MNSLRKFNNFSDYTQLRKDAFAYLPTDIHALPSSPSSLMPSSLIAQALALEEVVKSKVNEAQAEALATFLTSSYPRFKVPNLEMYMFSIKGILKQYAHFVGRHAVLKIIENEEFPPTAAMVKKWASGFDNEILEFIHVAKTHEKKREEIERLRLENHEYVGRKSIEEAFSKLMDELRQKNEIFCAEEKKTQWK